MVVLLLLFLTLFKLYNTTPIEQTAIFNRQMWLTDSLLAESKSADTTSLFEAGWSKVSLIPPFTTPIAIDAHRKGRHFEGIHDSVYVRAFVFKKGNTKVAFISADLLIIPSTVTQLADSMLTQNGFNHSNIYYTATHTHSSIGGWHNSYVGEIFAGKYDARVPEFIAHQIKAVILEAEKKCLPTTIGYAEAGTTKLVYNRLVTDMAHLPDSTGKIDSIVRIIKLQNSVGQTAVIATYSAHNTVYHESLMQLSGDWCGQMMKNIEASGTVDFCSFSAGAVGSHGPYKASDQDEAEAKYMANGVSEAVKNCLDTLGTHAANNLYMIRLPLLLNPPNLKLNKYISLRPWVFHFLFGKEMIYVNYLQLDAIPFIGLPCDFSGEITAELMEEHPAISPFIVTSFNGGYIGYVTHSKHENLNTYETQTMNWFGPGTGNHFKQLIEKMVLRH
ncbi:MAG: neutral/alkaline non-lysosomal ceramidase N-terminal domain-containing protein [Chitinophagales bacterium]|nr:neutral/alkaline non-lysosomal ceramidase N-terminal domain-containing protein [Chitinophagales bacterium]